MSSDDGNGILAPAGRSEELARMRATNGGTEVNLAYLEAMRALREHLKDQPDALDLLDALDVATLQLVRARDQAVLDRLVVGVYDPDAIPEDMEWRTTRRTNVNPIHEQQVLDGGRLGLAHANLTPEDLELVDKLRQQFGPLGVRSLALAEDHEEFEKIRFAYRTLIERVMGDEGEGSAAS